MSASHPHRSKSQHSGRIAVKPALRGRESTLFVSSVEKALNVLEAFDGAQAALTLSQIAERTKMDLSSTQRAVHTLTTLRYLNKDETTRQFELAPRLLDFSFRYLASNELARRAIPYVQQLARETEETTNLTILDDTEIVYIVRIASPHVLAPNVIVGTRIPAFCAAPGLAMLAYLPEEQAEDILERTDFVAYTFHPYQDKSSAMQRLRQIREMGYVRAEGEFYKGDVSTAAPVLDINNRPLGAVNISIATRRWDADRDQDRITNLVISAAAAISGHPR